MYSNSNLTLRTEKVKSTCLNSQFFHTSIMCLMKQLYSLNLKIMAFVIVATGLLSNKGFAQGTAPVSIPTGGFRIEGNLQANLPTVGVGDWVPGPAGGGGNVLTAAGVPINPTTTYHVVDAYNANDDILNGGNFNSDPNTTWGWKLGTANNKTDMNNVLLHFAVNPANNHAWFIFSGDRLSNTGTSYQDFEFLQGTLTKTGASPNGTWSASGPNGGRTVNDFLFTVEFTGGGQNVNFAFYKWIATGPTTGDYQLFTPPAGTAFGFTNSGGEAVPYTAFGLPTYPVGDDNAFVEGAVDLDAVVGAIVTTCSGINVHSFMSKTKVSTSSNATITDIITPIPLNLVIGFSGTTSTTAATCSGNCNGSATVFVTGGTSPYTYAWNTSPAQTTSTAVNLCAGTYTVTVTDSRPGGCTITETVTITQPTTITATASQTTSVSCNGGNNGCATVAVSGGTPNYAFSWSPSGGTGQTACGLTAGNYTVTVTDSHGCTRTATTTITQPAILTATATQSSSVNCFGGNNGCAIATGTGGTLAYTYLWNPTAQTTQTACGLSAGTYTVTITDARGCTRTDTAAITQPPLLTTASNHTDVNCFGGNNASAWTSPSGGTSPYIYSWSSSPVQTTQTATGLTAGSYTVVVTDQRGCNTTSIVTVTQPTQVTAAINSHTNASCFGQCNGTATATPGGGVGPYTYLWNPTAQTTQTAVNLCSGLYVVTVTDSHGCSTTTSLPVSITQPIQLTDTASAIDSVSCNGGNDGTVILTANGGTSPYTYAWSPNVSTTATASNLSALCYTIVVTDQNGCTTSTAACVRQPTALISSLGSSTNVLCNGGNTGSASITATGGSPQYSYTWDPPVSTTSAAATLTAGNYTVTVTDQNGCSTTTSFTITQPPALTATWDSTSSTCGQSDGSAWVNPTGGVGPYTYSWSPTGQTGQTATSIPAGSYQVTVTDSNGCSIIQNASVSDQTSPVTTATVVTDVGCYGDTTGVAYVAVTSGGTPPFTYSWSPGGATTATVTISVGSYNVTVTDANGCISNNQVNITQPPQLLSSIIDSSNVSCNGAGNGIAVVDVIGGSPTYTYSWSPAGGTGATASNLTPGSYSVTVTDSHGCSTVSTATITQPPSLLLTAVTVDSVGCHGEASGSIFTTPSGGTPTYTYTWLDCLGNLTGLLPTPDQVNNLSAGCYSVTVMDANGCSFDTSINVFEPDTIVPLIDAVTLNGFQITCFGDSNGVAFIDTIFGGTYPFTYVWSTVPPSSNDTIYNLHPGQYSVTVFDLNGCRADTFITLTQPTPLAAQISSDNVGCASACDGWVSIDATFGGIPPYTYNWSPTSSTLDSIGGLCPGIYTVTITDVNGCTMTAPTSVTEPPPLTMSASIDNFNGYNISCNGASDGCITVTILGGTAPYSYLWVPSAGNTTSSACGLAAGTYTVFVEDANHCLIQLDTTLIEPTLVTATTDTTDVLCNGSSTGTAFVNPGGGVPPYTYSWSPMGGPNQTATGLPQGTYTVTVTDLNGCSSTATAVVTEPTPVSATTTTTSVDCHGNFTGTATAFGAGGVGSYTYTWNTTPPQSGQTATGLSQGTYTVTVTDANGCSTVTTAVVAEPSQLAAVASMTPVICNAGSTGTASVIASGGVSGYAYLWNPTGQTGATATGLAAGCYTVTVTDVNGCTATDITCVTEPTQVNVAAANDSVICNGGATGIVTAIGSGGISGYTYVWSPIGQTGATVSNLSAGCYTVMVTDVNGCTTSTSTCITEPTAVNVNVTSSFVFCNTVSTGSATANASGGIPGYSYMWNPSGQTGQTATGLPINTYVVTVTDANGCTTSSSFTPSPYTIAVDAGPSDTICGLVDTLNGQVISATLPLQSISWTGSTGTIGDTSSLSTSVVNLQPAIPPSLIPNVFYLTIVDANGCRTVDTVSILAYEDIQADAQSPNVTICQDTFLISGYQLLAANPNPGNGIWTVNGTGSVSPNNSLSPVYTGGVPGPNTILWTVTNGPCRNQDTVVVTVKVDGYCLDLELPTGYTPNDDGYNDSYLIHGIEAYPENTFIVFNRWGNEVYHKDNYKNNGYNADWHGQNNDGKPLPTGTYYVILTVKNSHLFLNTYVDLRK
jgi:gliding motility-associated-like protein